MSTFHTCPYPGCRAKISNSLFACRPHWFRLSSAARAAVTATAGQHLLTPERWAAITDAMAEWRAISAPTGMSVLLTDAQREAVEAALRGEAP